MPVRGDPSVIKPVQVVASVTEPWLVDWFSAVAGDPSVIEPVQVVASVTEPSLVIGFLPAAGDPSVIEPSKLGFKSIGMTRRWVGIREEAEGRRYKK